MFEAELERFNSIVAERIDARLELDRILIRGHVPERYEAVNSYIAVLDRCIAELKDWNDVMLDKVEHTYKDRIGGPPEDDSAWNLIRQRQAWTLLSDWRQERDSLCEQLRFLKELNERPHDLSEPENGM